MFESTKQQFINLFLRAVLFSKGLSWEVSIEKWPWDLCYSGLPTYLQTESFRQARSQIRCLFAYCVTSWEIDGETVSDFIFWGSKITADGDCSHEIKRCLLLWRKVMTNLIAYSKAETLLCQQRSVWSRLWFFHWACMDVRVGLWRKLSARELMLLNCGIGEDSWESLGLQGDPTSPFWRRSALGFFGRNDAKAETLVLWPPHEKCWLIGKDWCWEGLGGRRRRGRQRMRWLDGIIDSMDMSFEWTLGVGDGQGGLEWCGSWGCKESDTTEWLNWTGTDYLKCKWVKSSI